MIDLKTINECLAKAKEDVLFWERARAVFLDPRIAGVDQHSQARPIESLPAPTPLHRALPRPYGDLKRRVYEALPAWGKSAVSTAGLVAYMERDGYVFVSKTPSISINEALVTLEKEEKILMAAKQGVTRFWTKAKPKPEDQQQTPP